MQFEVNIIYDISIWAVGVLFLLVLLLVLEVGHQIGLKQREHWVEKETAGGKMVLTALLTLLGLILSFTYLASVQRYEVRKQTAIMEANALGTAFLRADLVAEPGSTELKQALLDYARTRVSDKKKTVWLPEERMAFLQKTLKEQERLWPITENIIEESKPGPIETALVTAINHVLDVHNLRIAASLDKLPLAITLMMLVMAAAALGVAGFNAGIYGKMSRGRMTTFALVLTLILFVIQDYDRPHEGWIRVPDATLHFIILEMETELAQLSSE
jgi:hypothetical protein